ncbi:hypothetical protein FIBSPDRAFT_1053102 [Athelia psychrophila]|uniref:Uncharacterized protein n=1 Tax=Athelia psychrophila TaxID=1759441 RepID=A0A167XGQ8_9AGAM|nr:hypothetical protein FIBSPDRAFT_1053102 [Fibularhizoctonia sp. CBS 109695]
MTLLAGPPLNNCTGTSVLGNNLAQCETIANTTDTSFKRSLPLRVLSRGTTLDVPENKDSGSARADKDVGAAKAPVAPEEAQLEHGGASEADADRQGANETKSSTDCISDLQGLAKEKGHAGVDATEEAVEVPAPAPAAAKVLLSPPSIPRKACSGGPVYHLAVLQPMTPNTKAAAAIGSSPAVTHERPTPLFGSLSKKGGHGCAPSGSISSGKHNCAASVTTMSTRNIFTRISYFTP